MVTRCFYASYTLLWLCCFVRIISMGYYNKYGLWAIICVDCMFYIMKCQLFVILVFVSLDMKLKT